jgi:tripartite-type tricarboxylate transporter receptor subunit TctC
VEYIRAGKLKPLGVTSAQRSEAIPDVPPISDFVPGYEASAWYGVGAPRGTPPETIAKLNQAINAGLTDPKLRSRLAELGATPLGGAPGDFGQLVADETKKWGEVVRFARLKPE